MKNPDLILDVLLQLQNLNPEQTLLELSLGELTESQKRDLVILAASGGAIVPLEHLVSLSQDQNTRKSLRELMNLRLVQAHSPKYSLTGNLVAALASQWDLSTWEDALIDYFTDWLEKNPAQTLVEESAEVLIHVIKKAGEKKRWQNVIRMGRKLESVLALWKRWQAWADILELILKAAKAMGDKKVEAWVLHQLGSRAICLDFVDQARELLNQATNMRQAIGDQAGFELTQHNLNVLGKPLIPSRIQQKAGCRRYCVFGGIGVGVVILLGMAAIIFVVAKTLNFFGPDNKAIHNTDIPQMTSIPSMPTSTPKPHESLLPPATETYTVTPILYPYSYRYFNLYSHPYPYCHPDIYFHTIFYTYFNEYQDSFPNQYL